MNCQLCGELCRCPSEPPPTGLPRWKPDADSVSASDEVSHPDQRLKATPDEQETLDLIATEPGASVTPLAADSTTVDSTTIDSAWRDELSARLSRYRSRRKMRPPRYPSLRLQFDPPDSSRTTDMSSSSSRFEPVSSHALALSPSASVEQDAQPAAPHTVGSAPLLADSARSGNTPRTAKIIEFPGFTWEPPEPPPDQLAEPVGQQLRILEVPDIAPPLPALGGITIEVEQPKESARRPGIDIPLHTALIFRRISAIAIDGLIITAASALFGFIFWKIAAFRPPLLQLVGLAVGLPGIFWAAYQYLMIVYAGTTPGFLASGLELARFDGSTPHRSLRRWRVLASYLSVLSLCMGYAWLFLDEDSLCWHDRITRTYLAPRKPKDSSTVSRP
jgi:hypothetical protein